MVILAAIGMAVATLAQMVSVQFVLDWMARDRGVWKMPRLDTPTVYLTYHEDKFA
jgi:hypothetical protein